jgi:hypothetical protein
VRADNPILVNLILEKFTKITEPLQFSFTSDNVNDNLTQKHKYVLFYVYLRYLQKCINWFLTYLDYLEKHNMAAFCDRSIGPCRLVEIDRRFRGAYYLIMEAVRTSETSA